jgi:hypothetical protein
LPIITAIYFGASRIKRAHHALQSIYSHSWHATAKSVDLDGELLAKGWFEVSYTAIRSLIALNQAEITIGLTIVCVVQLVLLVALAIKLHRLLRSLNKLIGDTHPSDFVEALKSVFERIERICEDVRSLQRLVAELSERQEKCIQHVGIVRFDAFQDVGGEQSFSLAILDARGNGAVITSLFGRHESRCFAKPIIGWRSPMRLTEEEMEAMRIATSYPDGDKR